MCDAGLVPSAGAGSAGRGGTTARGGGSRPDACLLFDLRSGRETKPLCVVSLDADLGAPAPKRARSAIGARAPLGNVGTRADAVVVPLHVEVAFTAPSEATSVAG